MEKKRTRRPKKYTSEKALDAIHKRQLKWSYKDIADEHDVVPGTIRVWIRRLCEDKYPRIQRMLEKAGYDHLIGTTDKGPTIPPREKGAFLRAFLAACPKADYEMCAEAAAPTHISKALFRVQKKGLRKRKKHHVVRDYIEKPKPEPKRPTELALEMSNPKGRAFTAGYLTWWDEGEQKGYIPVLKAELAAANTQ